MAKLTRVTSIPFASTAPSQTVEEFGSKVQLGSPTYTTDPAQIQALAAWTNGWTTAINTGNKAPYVQDMNAFCLVDSYQISYILQQGIPEWDTATVYYKGSYVSDPAGSGQIWYSLQDNNTGNAPPLGASNAFWFFATQSPAVGNGLSNALVTQTNAGAPTTKVDITASVLSVQGVILSGVNLTADITASGANGLDTGSPAASTWYAIHVITNATGSLSASLLSLSATAPTLPGGYTVFRRVGWVRRNASNNFIAFYRVGRDIYYSDATALTSSPFGATSFASSVPSTTTLMQVAAYVGGSAGSAQYKPTAISIPVITFLATNNPGGSNVPVACIFQLQLDSSQSATFSGLGSTIVVLGYVDEV